MYTFSAFNCSLILIRANLSSICFDFFVKICCLDLKPEGINLYFLHRVKNSSVRLLSMVITPGTGFTICYIFFSILTWSGMFSELEKTCKSIGDTKAHINFTTRCLKSRLIPKGFLSKPRIHTSKAQQLEQRFACIRMTEQ